MKTTNKNKQTNKNKKNILGFGLIAIFAITIVLVIQQSINTKTSDTTDATTDTTTEVAEIKIKPNEGVLTILKSELTDQAKFYPYEVNGTKLEVLAFKASDGTIRTALNTCQVCYDSGRGYYVQEGDKLICQNCGNQFAADQVELVKGGCNPVPVMKENKIESETAITISEDFLAENTGLFENWRK